MSETKEVTEATVEETINTTIKQFDNVESHMAELQKEFGDITINGLDDDEGYKVVSDSLKIVKKVRTGIEGKRKELKEPVLKFGRAIDAEAKRLTALVMPLETKLSNEKQKIDDEKERIEREAKERAEKQFRDRSNQLIKMGMMPSVGENGMQYSYKDKTINDSMIREMDDAWFKQQTDEIESQMEIDAMNAPKPVATPEESHTPPTEQRTDPASNKLDELSVGDKTALNEYIQKVFTMPHMESERGKRIMNFWKSQIEHPIQQIKTEL